MAWRLFFCMILLFTALADVQAAPPEPDVYLASPEEVKLSGNIRREYMSSSLGRIELRWPRKVELLFGRTPQRAMADTATTASRALKASSFPLELQRLDLEWKVVFMDEELPETQIPRNLISNCHPAWMTPPANIYVVSQRVAAGCGGRKSSSQVADSELAHILLHEIGHVVEYQLLKELQGMDRMRAEGFASWFEQYSSEFSAIIPKGSVKKRYYSLAKAAFERSPNFVFTGSGSDYAQASMFFHAIVEKKGISALMDIYRLMYSERIGFFEAIKGKIYWDQKKLWQEIKRLLQI